MKPPTARLYFRYSITRELVRMEVDLRLWTEAQVETIREIRSRQDFDFSCFDPGFFIVQKGDKVPSKRGPKNFIWYDVGGRLHMNRIDARGKITLEVIV